MIVETAKLLYQNEMLFYVALVAMYMKRVRLFINFK